MWGMGAGGDVWWAAGKASSDLQTPIRCTAPRSPAFVHYGRVIRSFLAMPLFGGGGKSRALSTVYRLVNCKHCGCMCGVILQFLLCLGHKKATISSTTAN